MILSVSSLETKGFNYWNYLFHGLKLSVSPNETKGFKHLKLLVS